MRKKISVKVFNQIKYDGEWPPVEAMKFVAWLNEKLATIPDEYKESAAIEIDSTTAYEDSIYPTICIAYHRHETDEEMETRLSKEKMFQEAKRIADLKVFKELKEKYKL